MRREWVVYSAHRNERPWDGKREAPPPAAPAYDPTCYLCPGNPRVHGHKNPDYRDVFIFDNDHPVVGSASPEISGGSGGLYRRERADGVARVICYDPRHNVTLTDVPHAKAVKVFAAWREQTQVLAADPSIHSALFFENKGAIVGTSNPHPHCQLYATSFPFKHVEMEMEAVEEMKSAEGSDLFREILEAEQDKGVRIVAEKPGALAFIPFFARWPCRAPANFWISGRPTVPSQRFA